MKTRTAIVGVLGVAVVAALFYAVERRSSRAPTAESADGTTARGSTGDGAHGSGTRSSHASAGTEASNAPSPSEATRTRATTSASRDDGPPAGRVDTPSPTGTSPALTASAGDPDPRRPVGWGLTDEYRYRVRSDATSAWHGALSARVELRAEGSGTTALMQSIRADDYRGKRIAFDVYVRTEGRVAIVRPWVRVDSLALGRVVSFDNAANQGTMNEGTSAWTLRTIVIDVPASGDVISYGVILAGNGRLWVDAVSVDLVGPETPTTAPPLTIPNQPPPPRRPDPGRLARAPVNPDFEQTVPIDPSRDR